MHLRHLNPVVESVVAGIIGLVIGAAIMLVYGYDPISAYSSLFRGSFGSFYSWAESLANATPLILTALTFAVAMRGGLFNIGAEGQLYIGALAAVSVSLIQLPYPLHVVVALLAAMLAGMIWSLPVALLKLGRGVHEVISTIMFNWIAHFFAFYLIANVLTDPLRGEKTISIVETSRLARMVPQTSLNYGLIIALVAVAVAGAVQVMGRPPTYAVLSGLPQFVNLGFDGIGVAMIGRNHPIGIVIAAIFFGGLLVGGRIMQFSPGVPLELVRVIEGVIILALAVPELRTVVVRVWAKTRSRRQIDGT